jgi:acetyl-CoA synthetase
MHTTGGYLTYAAMTHKFVFDVRDNDVYACMADVGWITGHSYIVYGPLTNGSTTFLFEGLPTYPDAGRYWDMVQRHRITLFYTAPTAIRTLMKSGEGYVTKYDRSSLRVLGTVGEPINPAAWQWYFSVVGDGKCSVVDTYWQTETGGHILTPLPGCTPCVSIQFLRRPNFR